MADLKQDGKDGKRNTKNLSRRLGVDAMSAVTAGGLVAPLITTVDKCIIENASGKRPMMESIKKTLKDIAFRPHKFFLSRPFRIVYLVYGSTYLAANTLDTFKSTTKNRAASSTTHGLSKFAATSATNMSLTLYKDSQFTKLFGTVSARPIPPVSYALFALRDGLTIFASFNLPPLLAPHLPLSDDIANKYFSRATAAQFLIPAGMQFISTPLHLFGLDLYNRNGDTTLAERVAKVRADFMKSTLARMCRIIPAFGIGGVINTRMRRNFMEALE